MLKVCTQLLEHVHLRKTQFIIGYMDSEEGSLQYVMMTAVGDLTAVTDKMVAATRSIFQADLRNTYSDIVNTLGIGMGTVKKIISENWRKKHPRTGIQGLL